MTGVSQPTYTQPPAARPIAESRSLPIPLPHSMNRTKCGPQAPGPRPWSSERVGRGHSRPIARDSLRGCVRAADGEAGMPESTQAFPQAGTCKWGLDSSFGLFCVCAPFDREIGCDFSPLKGVRIKRGGTRRAAGCSGLNVHRPNLPGALHRALFVAMLAVAPPVYRANLTVADRSHHQNARANRN